MTTPRDVEIEFEELDRDHGGRQQPLVTDSRPQFYYLGHDWDCRVEIIAPGATSPRIGVRAYLAFLSPADHFGRMRPGMPFLFREGQRTIGFGTIVSLLELEASAERHRADPHYYSWHHDAAT
jgi:translation elongation factor EF-Tu-like GTPase